MSPYEIANTPVASLGRARLPGLNWARTPYRINLNKLRDGPACVSVRNGGTLSTGSSPMPHRPTNHLAAYGRAGLSSTSGRTVTPYGRSESSGDVEGASGTFPRSPPDHPTRARLTEETPPKKRRPRDIPGPPLPTVWTRRRSYFQTTVTVLEVDPRYVAVAENRTLK